MFTGRLFKNIMTQIHEIIPRMPKLSPNEPEIMEMPCGHHIYKSPDKQECHLCKIEDKSPWNFVKTETKE
jgi:hypothetical protein